MRFGFLGKPVAAGLAHVSADYQRQDLSWRDASNDLLVGAVPDNLEARCLQQSQSSVARAQVSQSACRIPFWP